MEASVQLTMANVECSGVPLAEGQIGCVSMASIYWAQLMGIVGSVGPTKFSKNANLSKDVFKVERLGTAFRSIFVIPVTAF